MDRCSVNSENLSDKAGIRPSPLETKLAVSQSDGEQEPCKCLPILQNNCNGLKFGPQKVGAWQRSLSAVLTSSTRTRAPGSQAKMRSQSHNPCSVPEVHFIETPAHMALLQLPEVLILLKQETS